MTNNTTNPYAEYRTNLYSDAMGCVTNSTGSNVYPVSEYPDGIPADAVRARFALETAEAYENTFTVPGEPMVTADGPVMGPDLHVSTGTHSWARVRDHREFARFGSESAASRRQYTWLLDTYAAGLIGADGLRITAAGTTRNGGRAYIQFALAETQNVGGIEFGSHLFCFMSADGTLSIGGTFGNQILSCANMVAGLVAKAKVKSKQTKNVTDNGILARHRVALGLDVATEAATDLLTTWAQTEFGPAHWSALLDDIAPVNVEGASKTAETRNENTRATLTGFWNADPRVTVCEENTLLRAFQAVNTFDIWERGTRGDTDNGVRMVDEFLSGSLAKREASRAESFERVLALV